MGILKRTAFVLATPVWVSGLVVFTAINMAGIIIALPTLGIPYYIKTGKAIPPEYFHLGYSLEQKYDIRNKIGTMLRKL